MCWGRFPRYDWAYSRIPGCPGESAMEETFEWFGPPDEDELPGCVQRYHETICNI